MYKGGGGGYKRSITLLHLFQEKHSIFFFGTENNYVTLRRGGAGGWPKRLREVTQGEGEGGGWRVQKKGTGT